MPGKTIDQLQQEFDHITDRLGQPLDRGIKETVIYLNALGFPTQQSCEGHLDSGRPYPWVLIAAEGEPPERYIGQKQIFQKVAAKYTLPLADVEHIVNEKAWREAILEAMDQPETPEHKAWATKNQQLRVQLDHPLEDYYRHHQVKPTFKLTTIPIAEYVFFLQPNIPIQEGFMWTEATSEELDKVKHKLEEYQQEMSVFTQYLKNNFETLKAKIITI